MVASNYIVKEAIEVNLPKAATGEEMNTENKSIALILKKDGRLFLNGERTTKEKIAQAMIAADNGTPHGEVVKLIDLIRINGLTSFAINIDPDNDPIVDEDVTDEEVDKTLQKEGLNRGDSESKTVNSSPAGE